MTKHEHPRGTRAGARRLAGAMLFAPAFLFGDAAQGAQAAAGAEAAAPRVAGTYTYAGGDAEREAWLAAIEAVVGDMFFIARPIARNRLRDGTVPSEGLTITITADRIVILRPGRPTVSAPRDGRAITWRSPEGDAFEVRHRVVGENRVIQEFVGDGNRSVNTFTLDADGARLTVDTAITADRLPKPLQFRITYRRRPDGP